MSDLTIQLLGGVSHGKIVTIPDTVEKICVPVVRVKCEHSPDGAGVETVTVTYRQGENTRPGNWVADQDFHHLGWWCQECSAQGELVIRTAQVKELRADIERVRELHKSLTVQDRNGREIQVCSECLDGGPWRLHQDYPCPTIKALDGDR
jgi:hypothetical protein